MAENARGALVFGARNLGKAIIETLRGAAGTWPASRDRIGRSKASPHSARSRSAPT